MWLFTWFLVAFSRAPSGQLFQEFCFIIDHMIAKEIQAVCIMGPFGHPWFHNLKVSSLGVIPQKVLGEFRMIHYLSSHCDYIRSEFCLVQYAMVDDAV